MKLVSPPGDRVRPTAEKTRQALFDILGPRIRDVDMLDLCCGTGIMGLEALSRGARSCLFIDSMSQACRIVERNLEKTRLAGRGTVRKSDVTRFLRHWTPADHDWFVYADPPYRETRLYSSILTELGSKAASASLVIALEHPLTLDLNAPEILTLQDERRYGSTRISIFTSEASVW